MARLWVEGYNKRYDATYHIGYVIARSALKPYCKSLPKNYPYSISKDDDTVIDEMPEMDEEQQQEKLDKMKAEMLARMQKDQDEK